MELERLLKKGKINEDSIDDLVEQIFYRTADFGFLLKREKKELSDYCEMLIYGDMDLD